MKLKGLLSEKKPQILKRWFDEIVQSYPADTSNFLKNQKNQFANPVGHTISKGIEDILDELLSGNMNKDRVSGFLDTIIRVRAVQDFTPSRAIAFIFVLKRLVREELAQEAGLEEEMMELDAEIDSLALICFDIYMKCREKLYEVQANELRSSTFRLLERANLLFEKEQKEKREVTK